MPPSPRKTPARKAATAEPTKPAKSPFMADFEPVVIDDTPDTDVEMVDFFQVGDRMYQVPARPPAGLALQAMKLMREYGNTGVAEMMILEEVVGPEAWDALCSANIKGPQLAKLANAASMLVFGALEDEDGPGNS